MTTNVVFVCFSGVIREGESYLVGPLLDGRFLPAKISTIHRYRVPRRMVRAAQAASFSLLHVGGSRLRKVNPFRRALLSFSSIDSFVQGMVIVSSSSNPRACHEFTADIYLSMHHTNTPIRKGFETTVLIENIRQTAFIVDMNQVRLE
jgi:GTPase